MAAVSDTPELARKRERERYEEYTQRLIHEREREKVLFMRYWLSICAIAAAAIAATAF